MSDASSFVAFVGDRLEDDSGDPPFAEFVRSRLAEMELGQFVEKATIAPATMVSHYALWTKWRDVLRPLFRRLNDPSSTSDELEAAEELVDRVEAEIRRRYGSRENDPWSHSG